MKNSKKALPYMLLLPTLLFLLTVSIYPLVFNFYTSFQEYVLYRPNYISFVGVGNYIYLITADPKFLQAIKVTLLLLGESLLLQIPLGVGLALLLNRNVRGTRIIKTMMVFPMMLTPIITALLFKMMYHSTLGIINYLIGFVGIHRVNWLGSPSYALLSLVITDTWQWTPFTTLVVLAGLSSLPKEPYEAALTDGASSLQTFRYITLPLIKNTIVIAIILRSIWIFRMFDKIYIMTSGGPENFTTTLGYYVYQVGLKWLDYGVATALAIIMFYIIGALCSFYIKFLK